MAGCDLIKKSVVEKHAARRNGRRVGYQRNLSQPPRAIIRGDELLQNFLSLGGSRFDDSAFLKTNLDPLNHCALMRQRLGCSDGTVGAVLVWRGENLLCRHVGNTVEAVARGGAASEPKMIV